MQKSHMINGSVHAPGGNNWMGVTLTHLLRSVVSKMWPAGRMWPLTCIYLAFRALLLPQIQGTIPSTDSNDGALLLPVTPMMGQHFSQ